MILVNNFARRTGHEKTETIVYCQECGSVIARLTYLMTPSMFKEKFGEICLNCGHMFNDSFNIASEKHKQKTLTGFVNGET